MRHWILQEEPPYCTDSLAIVRMLALEKFTHSSVVLLATLLLVVVSGCSATETRADSLLVSSSLATAPSLAPLKLGQAHAPQYAFQLDRPSARDQMATTNRRPPRLLRVGSLNIRYDYHSRHPVLSGVSSAVSGVFHHAKRPWGEHRWQERCDQLVDQVLFHDLDVVGFQEVLHGQLGDLQDMMGERDWAHVGVGRDDGKEAGEAVPIFYRRSRLELVSVQHSWLSPTPTVPGSKGWDAGQPRMITLARFRDLALDTRSSSSSPPASSNRCELVVANTHWDDRGLQAREESAKLILRLVEEQVAAASVDEALASALPLVVLVGDLNSPPSEAGYQVLTGSRYPVEAVEEQTRDPVEPAVYLTAFYDARHELVKRRPGIQVSGGAMSRRFGPSNTYTGFEPSDVAKVIDFVLPLGNAAFLPAAPAGSATAQMPSVAANQVRQTRWRVTRYGVVQNFFEDIGGRRGKDRDDDKDAMILSDHRLVVAAFEEISP